VDGNIFIKQWAIPVNGGASPTLINFGVRDNTSRHFVRTYHLAEWALEIIFFIELVCYINNHLFTLNKLPDWWGGNHQPSAEIKK